jgi:hypothetical protein
MSEQINTKTPDCFVCEKRQNYIADYITNGCSGCYSNYGDTKDEINSYNNVGRITICEKCVIDYEIPIYIDTIHPTINTICRCGSQTTLRCMKCRIYICEKCATKCQNVNIDLVDEKICDNYSCVNCLDSTMCIIAIDDKHSINICVKCKKQSVK